MLSNLPKTTLAVLDDDQFEFINITWNTSEEAHKISRWEGYST